MAARLPAALLLLLYTCLCAAPPGAVAALRLSRGLGSHMVLQ
jgi:hypothetical protein